MSAIIHLVKPQRATVFEDYTEMHLLPFLEKQTTEHTTRVDAVWDRYLNPSLKSQTRMKRSETGGRRIRVSAKIPIPKGTEWQKFLKESQNKAELYQFLSEELVKHTNAAKYLFLTTKEDQVLSNRPTDVTSLTPCRHEEADTRLMLHLHHASEEGHRKAYIRTVDTDVVVLGIYYFNQMNLTELWIGFGSGKAFKEIPIHYICEQLGFQRCQALPFFHAYTGCDLTSAMLGIGKKTTWNVWFNFPEIIDTFIAITQNPSSLTLESSHMQRLECFTVSLYTRNCSVESVNEARKVMFIHSLKPLDSIPPTQHALFQHAKRALLTAAFIWGQSLSKEPDIPDPTNWGWEWNARTEMWMPYWTDLPDASKG